MVFQSPDTYIPPQHDDREEDVPAWNYVAVHAYGTVHFLENSVFKMLPLQAKGDILKSVLFPDLAVDLKAVFNDSEFED